MFTPHQPQHLVVGHVVARGQKDVRQILHKEENRLRQSQRQHQQARRMPAQPSTAMHPRHGEGQQHNGEHLASLAADVLGEFRADHGPRISTRRIRASSLSR
jgi:hypothetical protein